MMVIIDKLDDDGDGFKIIVLIIYQNNKERLE